MDSIKPLTEEIVEESLSALIHRVDETLRETGDAFPYIADPEIGDWRTTEDGNWAAGHWIGLLWLASRYVDDPSDSRRFERAARNHIEKMCTQNFDNIFMGMGTMYAGFRGYDVTNDRSLFGLGLSGADAMIDLYNEVARQIPIGEYEFAEPGRESVNAKESDEPPMTQWAAVDIVYTSLPVLWRAYEETGDPRFRDIAVSHTDRHLDWHVREDGSIQQIAIFNTETGKIENQFSGLAYSDDTCWARGMGWNIAGLSRAYRETSAERYLRTLERSVNYYTDNAPPDLIPYWDFEAPFIPSTPRDTSAAALTAYGLIRLRGNAKRIKRMREIGKRVLKSLLSNYLVRDKSDPQYGSILHGTLNKPEEYGVDMEHIWTNYYVTYTLDSLRNSFQDKD